MEGLIPGGPHLNTVPNLLLTGTEVFSKDLPMWAGTGAFT